MRRSVRRSSRRTVRNTRRSTRRRSARRSTRRSTRRSARRSTRRSARRSTRRSARRSTRRRRSRRHHMKGGITGLGAAALGTGLAVGGVGYKKYKKGGETVSDYLEKELKAEEKLQKKATRAERKLRPNVSNVNPSYTPKYTYGEEDDDTI